MKTDISASQKKRHIALIDSLFIAIIGLIPFRNIHVGIDWWDTGYNFANFKNMGLEHMDPMWYYATYLSNAVGHFMSLLPGGDTLVGLNFYTAIILSLTALLAYFFMTRIVKAKAIPSFIGIAVAEWLCWCPTALLYNYLTYLFLTAAVIMIYFALTTDSDRLLFGAGVVLALNVSVRFSNLPEAALIIAVWAYGLLEFVFEKKDNRLKRTLRRTLFAVLGYLAAVFDMLVILLLHNGVGNYVKGIKRLFSMTETATDYTAVSMIKSIIRSYTDMIYWLLRFLFFGAVAFILCFGIYMLRKRVFSKKPVLQKLCTVSMWVVSIAASVLAICWFYLKDEPAFCSLIFTSYDSILRPATMFMLIIMILALVKIFLPKVAVKDKLLSGLVIMLILITSIGSNNNVFPSINNLFIAAPYIICDLYDLVVENKNKLLIPAKALCCAFFALLLFQSFAFADKFTFAEATGVSNSNGTTKTVPSLKGVLLQEERVSVIEGGYEYLENHGLIGDDAILFGGIPSLSFYYDLPAAFNPWPDLDSYGVSVWEEDLKKTEKKMNEDSDYIPVVIIEADTYEKINNSINSFKPAMAEKARLLIDFIEKNGYVADYSNEKFVIFVKL